MAGSGCGCGSGAHSSTANLGSHASLVAFCAMQEPAPTTSAQEQTISTTPTSATARSLEIFGGLSGRSFHVFQLYRHVHLRSCTRQVALIRAAQRSWLISTLFVYGISTSCPELQHMSTPARSRSPEYTVSRHIPCFGNPYKLWAGQAWKLLSLAAP